MHGFRAFTVSHPQQMPVIHFSVTSSPQHWAENNNHFIIISRGHGCGLGSPGLCSWDCCQPVAWAALVWGVFLPACLVADACCRLGPQDGLPAQTRGRPVRPGLPRIMEAGFLERESKRTRWKLSHLADLASEITP